MQHSVQLRLRHERQPARGPSNRTRVLRATQNPASRATSASRRSRTVGVTDPDHRRAVGGPVAVVGAHADRAQRGHDVAEVDRLEPDADGPARPDEDGRVEHHAPTVRVDLAQLAPPVAVVLPARAVAQLVAQVPPAVVDRDVRRRPARRGGPGDPPRPRRSARRTRRSRRGGPGRGAAPPRGPRRGRPAARRPRRPAPRSPRRWPRARTRGPAATR